MLKAAWRTWHATAIERARNDAFDWLKENSDGYPRSWAQEEIRDKQRGYPLYDDFEAPPIAGYESLELGGLAKRLEVVIHSGEERVHFRICPGRNEDA